MAHLKMIKGFAAGSLFALGDEVFLGRSPDNSIALPEGRVSRQHARIVCKNTRTFFIEDLSSANGVYLGYERIPPATLCELQDGDEISIGSSRFVFCLDLPATASQQNNTGSNWFSASATGIRQGGQRGGTLPAVTLGDAEEHAPQVAITFDASSVMLEGTSEGEQPTQVLRETIKRLRAMCQVSTALGAITERDDLLYKIIDCVFEIFPGAERALLMLYDAATNDLVPAASRTWQEETGSQGVVVIPRTVVNEVIAHKHSILCLDALDDIRFNNHTSVLNLSIRSIMCVPLVFREELVGLLHVDTRTRTHNFTSEDLQMLTGIAAQAAIAIKTLQLHEAIEAESARRASLQRYFSPPLVAMLMSSGRPPELGGNLYRGTILFADIIGFTAMSERVTPAQIVTKLNRYFTIMQKVIYENRGNVDKFGGDAIMAFWGVPHATAEDECDAVLTAIQMQEKLWPFNLELSSEGQQAIHMGLGLHSGEFIAGNIGSEDKIDFTLIGDTVNLTARIECLASRYQVFVSAETWRAIRPLTCAVQLPPVFLKGKTHPVTVYSIRAIYDHCRSGYAMALPCQVCNAYGQHVGHGMVVYWQPGEKYSTIQVNIDTPLSIGMHCTVHCLLPEYHEALVLHATVDTVVLIRDATLCPYTQATLRMTIGPATQAFFTPGSCLQTTQVWENLERL